VVLPGGEGGVGFDDLRYDARSARVIVPAGRTGNIALIEPKSNAVTTIAGFSKAPRGGEGHGESVTSADVGDGVLYATDRTAREVAVVDLKTRAIVERARLAGPPDYVRWVAPTREVWVTEPGAKRIEVFATDAGGGKLAHAAFIDVPGGPESLVIDARRRRAYTHKWKQSTVAIDLASRAVVATWAAGCGEPRGIALDEARGLVLVGCEDGTVSALDVEHDGHVASSVKTRVSGVDIIAYDAGRAHLYVPGDESGTMAIVGVGGRGALSVLGVLPAAKGAHCVASDQQGSAYVCDPRGGRILVVRDPYDKTPAQ
jgi:DNA-binding beta-propeller fold protein YncE